MWTGEWQWVQLRDSGRGYSPVCPEDSTICYALVAVAQAGEGSSILNILCAKDKGNENIQNQKESEGISGWGQNLKIFPPEWKEWIIHLAIS